MHKLVLAAALVASLGCGRPEVRLREQLASGRGRIVLPAGVTEVSAELAIPNGARDVEVVGAPGGSVLRASNSFRGRAILRMDSASNVRLSGFSIDGNRAGLEKRTGLPPSGTTFSRFTEANGILAEGIEGLNISDVRFTNVAGFAVLAARSKSVRIERVQVEDSGSRNALGRNNSTGGILLEEGVAGFQVLECSFRNVRGNGVWTHSLYTSPRSRDGLIANNRFENIGRDAIQTGHAESVRVENNSGSRIGYPFDAVDMEALAVPVALDTAGNVSGSRYTGNRFEEVNGKCIDLDGFHDGEVRNNTCINRGSVDDYPYGNFPIVFNNTNLDMQSEGVTLAGNVIDGARFGAIFLIGTRHKVEGNILRRLNLAGCNENAAKYGCLYDSTQTDLLRSGIYLGRGGSRPAPARGNVIRDNQISGHGMRARCVVSGPGVVAAANTVSGNRCSEGAGN
jgi:hypothetical protein